MVKINYSKINIKAAAITGAVIGFLCSLFMMMSFGMMPMYSIMSGIAGAGYQGFSVFYLYFIIYVTLVGIVIGTLIAVVYNYVLEQVD